MNESLDHRGRCSLRSMALRLFTAFMCGWLFMVPQVMYSSAVMDLCQEHGTNTPPLIEEEEVHQAGVPPRSLLVSGHAPCDLDEVELPHWEELLLHTLHGEVPHPPPWA